MYLVIGGPSDDIGDNDSPEFYGLPWLPDSGLRISKPSIQAFRKQAGSETGKFSRPLTDPRVRNLELMIIVFLDRRIV